MGMSRITNKKAVPHSIKSVGHRADPGFLVVSPQMTLVINPVVGCYYFSPGPWLLFQSKRSLPLAMALFMFCVMCRDSAKCRILGVAHAGGAMTPKFELRQNFCTMHLPPSFIILCLLVWKLSCQFIFVTECTKIW